MTERSQSDISSITFKVCIHDLRDDQPFALRFAGTIGCNGRRNVNVTHPIWAWKKKQKPQLSPLNICLKSTLSIVHSPSSSSKFTSFWSSLSTSISFSSLMGSWRTTLFRLFFGGELIVTYVLFAPANATFTTSRMHECVGHSWVGITRRRTSKCPGRRTMGISYTKLGLCAQF